jgi:hypothetical protein
MTRISLPVLTRHWSFPGDSTAAHTTLAPWLTAEWTVTRLDSLEALREDTEGISAEVTDQNFLGWFPIRIQTEEEDSHLTDLEYLASFYAIAVSTPDGNSIGFIKFEE